MQVGGVEGVFENGDEDGVMLAVGRGEVLFIPVLGGVFGFEEEYGGFRVGHD